MTDETDTAVELPELQRGILSGTVVELPVRPLARALDALRPDPADEAERRVLARLKPLHEQMVERIDQQAAQLIECERRLRALENNGGG